MRRWLLVTGQPGAGKTTAVRALSQELQQAGIECQGFYTEETLDSNGQRTGFDVVTIEAHPQRGILARKAGILPTGLPKVGQYSVDVESFERIALPVLTRPSDVHNRVLVLDEVGRMELLSSSFKEAVNDLLATEGLRLVGAITAPRYGHRVPFCDEIASTPGIAVHNLTPKSREGVLKELLSQLRAEWIAPELGAPTEERDNTVNSTEQLDETGMNILGPILELYFKTLAELEGMVSTVIMPLRAQLDISGVNLTFKGKESADLNIKACALLRQKLPSDMEVHAVWSSKNDYVRTTKRAKGGSKLDGTFERFLDYSSRVDANSVLVVSGTGIKKPLDSLETLQRIQRQNLNESLPKIGCAFNAYIGGELDPQNSEQDRAAEFDRLRLKLATGTVSYVWLQFGVECNALREGLEYLDHIVEELGCKKPLVIGSVFVPSKAWVAKMKFRCWAGCYLGDRDSGEYLGSVDGATNATIRILDLYRRFDVRPVIESSIRNPREVIDCVGLFKASQ